MKKIVLASTSPRRKELLEQIGLTFEVVPSDYEEDMTLKMEPKKLVRFLSQGKAKDVAGKLKNSIVIACDTFLTYKKKILGKPHTAKQAKITLNHISGKIISMLSGITVIDTDTGKMICKTVETKVHLQKLSDKEILGYIKSKEPLDKAGAFGIQGLGALLVKKIDGDYYNVVGLPLQTLVQILKKFDISVL